jgi:hypothetical protein
MADFLPVRLDTDRENTHQPQTLQLRLTENKKFSTRQTPIF